MVQVMKNWDDDEFDCSSLRLAELIDGKHAVCGNLVIIFIPHLASPRTRQEEIGPRSFGYGVLCSLSAFESE
jgi:hypothetical protein